MSTTYAPNTRRPSRVPEDARPTLPSQRADGPLFTPPAPPAEDPPPAAPADTKVPVETLREAYPLLREPFAQRLIELKPGALTKDQGRALAMPYADMRAYFARLDRVVGPDGWATDYVPTDRGLICRLTILGTTKSGVGDYPLDRGDENPGTSAEAQAFKRACAAFGLGRYLYALPQIWCEYDRERKQIINPAGVVAEMYRRAEI